MAYQHGEGLVVMSLGAGPPLPVWVLALSLVHPVQHATPSLMASTPARSAAGHSLVTA
jgi:hypothetical protein